VCDNLSLGHYLSMISWLEGSWRNGSLITSGGVGYLVSTPHKFSEGEMVNLRIISIFRETGYYLYGFKDNTEEKIFLALTKIQGVGPSAAIALLANLGVSGFVGAIKEGNLSLITSVPGVGKKLSERILGNISLSDELLKLGSEPTSTNFQELVASLVELGFSFDLARDSVTAAYEEKGEEDESLVLQSALEFARGVK